MDIPWTPRTIKRAAAKSQPESSFETIREVIIQALSPFDDARIAVSEALLKLDRQPGYAT